MLTQYLSQQVNALQNLRDVGLTTMQNSVIELMQYFHKKVIHLYLIESK